MNICSKFDRKGGACFKYMHKKQKSIKHGQLWHDLSARHVEYVAGEKALSLNIQPKKSLGSTKNNSRSSKGVTQQRIIWSVS